MEMGKFYISTVPVADDDFEKEHVLMLPSNEMGVKVLSSYFFCSILYNVLSNSGQNRVEREDFGDGD